MINLEKPSPFTYSTQLPEGEARLVQQGLSQVENFLSLQAHQPMTDEEIKREPNGYMIVENLSASPKSSPWQIFRPAYQAFAESPFTLYPRERVFPELGRYFSQNLKIPQDEVAARLQLDKDFTNGSFITTIASLWQLSTKWRTKALSAQASSIDLVFQKNIEQLPKELVTGTATESWNTTVAGMCMAFVQSLVQARVLKPENVHRHLLQQGAKAHLIQTHSWTNEGATAFQFLRTAPVKIALLTALVSNMEQYPLWVTWMHRVLDGLKKESVALQITGIPLNSRCESLTSYTQAIASWMQDGILYSR